MKHLVKKYVNALKVGEEVVEVINKATIDKNALLTISENKMSNHYAMALSEDNHFVHDAKLVFAKKACGNN